MSCKNCDGNKGKSVWSMIACDPTCSNTIVIPSITQDTRSEAERVYERFTGAKITESTRREIENDMRRLLYQDEYEDCKTSDREIAKIVLAFFLGQTGRYL